MRIEDNYKFLPFHFVHTRTITIPKPTQLNPWPFRSASLAPPISSSTLSIIGKHLLHSLFLQRFQLKEIAIYQMLYLNKHWQAFTATIRYSYNMNDYNVAGDGEHCMRARNEKLSRVMVLRNVYGITANAYKRTTFLYLFRSNMNTLYKSRISRYYRPLPPLLYLPR